MSLFKISITRYVDDSGRQVRKNTPGARPQRKKSRKWYGEYRDEHGKLQRVPLAADKTSARAMLNDLIKNTERREAGLVNNLEEHQQRPIAEHLADYRTALAGKGDTKQHVKQTVNRISRIIDGCRFERLSDIDATKVSNWLAEARATKKKFSIQTSNYYGQAVRAFCAWLEQNDRLARNPLLRIKPLNAETDRRHARRSLSDEEFAHLIKAAESGGAVQGVSGPDRAMLYILAAWTGFRRRELSSIVLRSFDFDADPPTLKVKAGYSKRRRKD